LVGGGGGEVVGKSITLLEFSQASIPLPSDRNIMKIKMLKMFKIRATDFFPSFKNIFC
jgi:hypothetical protein